MRHADRSGPGVRTGDAYALVTAACNEEAFIEATLQSVVAQRHRPTAWIVVSDGSTDGTDAIAQRYAARYPFIRFVRREATRARSFQSKSHAVELGLARLWDLPVDFIGNLDADVTIEPAYCETLLAAFRQDDHLGIAGGWICEATDGSSRPRAFNAVDAVPHGLQLVRRECLVAIGGYLALPYGGEDAYAGLLAEMRGWRVRAFEHLPVQHHRPSASAGPRGRNYIRQGLMDYSLGYHWLYELGKCARRTSERPFLVRSALRLLGFGYASLRREPRPVSPAFMAYVRRRQLSRVGRLLRLPVP